MTLSKALCRPLSAPGPLYRTLSNRLGPDQFLVPIHCQLTARRWKKTVASDPTKIGHIVTQPGESMLFFDSAVPWPIIGASLEVADTF